MGEIAFVSKLPHSESAAISALICCGCDGKVSEAARSFWLNKCPFHTMHFLITCLYILMVFSQFHFRSIDEMWSSGFIFTSLAKIKTCSSGSENVVSLVWWRDLSPSLHPLSHLICTLKVLTDTITLTEGQFRVCNHCKNAFFKVWEDLGPRGNPHRDRENMQSQPWTFLLRGNMLCSW